MILSHLKGMYQRIRFASVLNYLPGLVILVFGMLALHASLRVMETREYLASYYAERSEDIMLLKDKYYEYEHDYVAYLQNEEGGSVEKVRSRLKEFTKIYYDRLTLRSVPNIEGQDDQFFAVLHGVENDLIAQVKHLDSLGQGVYRPLNIPEIVGDLEKIHDKIESLWGVIHDQDFTSSISAKRRAQERLLYWSVIAIGLSGFLLVVLNAHKLIQLDRANEEKRKNLMALQQQVTAMECSFDGIGIIDKNNILTYMNSALMALHGVAPEHKNQFIGRDWRALYSGKGREEIDEYVLPELAVSGHWRGERTVQRQDGTLVQAELSLTALPEGGFIGTARDVTERRKAQKEKEEIQTQFYQAQKMEAVGRLAGGVAHDFNNILAAMNGYAEFLVQDLSADSPQHKFADNILKAVDQAKRLVDQILAFSRVKESETKSIDMLVPFEESMSMVRASFPKSIELETTVDIDQAPINGNATQISQVIMNLCVNAKDAMENDHGALSIDIAEVNAKAYRSLGLCAEELPDRKGAPAWRIDEPHPNRARLLFSTIKSGQKYISLKVTDTGSGMNRMVMEHVFEPFFTTKPVDQGTGLGLSTVHGVLVEHQAAMIIDSELGQGTSFELLFPALDDVKAAKEAEHREDDIDVSDGKILLVEDQENVRDMMINMLNRMSVSVQACADGSTALDCLRENPGAFDLVITDQNMPNMTGLELISEAGADFPDLPFILLSGYSQEKIQGLMDDHKSVKAVLRKPVSNETLKAQVGAVLSEAKAKSTKAA